MMWHNGGVWGDGAMIALYSKEQKMSVDPELIPAIFPKGRLGHLSGEVGKISCEKWALCTAAIRLNPTSVMTCKHPYAL